MRVLSKRTLRLRAAALLFLCAPLVAGCVAPAVHPVLDQAGAAVERARSAPRVRALAAAELDRAEMALEHARAAAEAGAPPDQVEHMAYIVSQRAALAETRAAERVARSEVEALQRTLDQVVVHGPSDRNRHTRAWLDDDRRRRGLGRGRQERDRLEGAPVGARDQQDRASLQPDQQEHAPEEDQRERVTAEEDRQNRTSIEGHQQENAILEDDPEHRASVEEGRQDRASVEEDRQDRASVKEDRQDRASVGEDQEERASVEVKQADSAIAEENQQDRAPLEQDQQEHALEEDRQDRAPLEQDRQEHAPEEDRHGHAIAQEDRSTPGAEPALVGPVVEPVPQEIPLSLAQLPFDGAEPTSDALEQLAALAERLVREPGSGVLIEADFDLPDPEARTVMERRVEVVRAVLVRRGIAPARLVVRATGGGSAEPPAAPSFVEPAD